MLVFGTPDHGEKPGVISPWIDAAFAPIDDYLVQIDEQTHRRFIKTHTPLDGIPYFPQCTYLVVLRDPRDMFFSLRNHQDNMADPNLAGTIMHRGDDEFEQWVQGSLDPDNFDHQTIESSTHFLATYWDYRDLPNMHLFHYFEMKQDLKSHIAKTAEILGISLTEEQLAVMTDTATFENMRAKGEQFAPESGTGMWKKEADFFATGKNSQYKDQLTDAQLAMFDERIDSLLDAEQKAWLLRS